MHSFRVPDCTFQGMSVWLCDRSSSHMQLTAEQYIVYITYSIYNVQQYASYTYIVIL